MVFVELDTLITGPLAVIPESSSFHWSSPKTRAAINARNGGAVPNSSAAASARRPSSLGALVARVFVGGSP